MTCSVCADLRRQLREAREEIEAWEAGKHEEAQVDCSLERLARWEGRLRTRRHGSVLALMLLASRPGIATTRDQIVRAARRSPHAATRDDTDTASNLASVLVFHARQGLKRCGLKASIANEWGVGWSMDAASAREVMIAMGDQP